MDPGLSVRDASQKPDCPSNTITITFSHTPRARDKQRCDRARAVSVLYNPGPPFSKSQHHHCCCLEKDQDPPPFGTAKWEM